MAHWLLIVATFPEGIIWPGLRESWYGILCALWFPVGLTLMVRAALTP